MCHVAIPATGRFYPQQHAKQRRAERTRPNSTRLGQAYRVGFPCRLARWRSRSAPGCSSSRPHCRAFCGATPCWWRCSATSWLCAWRPRSRSGCTAFSCQHCSWRRAFCGPRRLLMCAWPTAWRRSGRAGTWNSVGVIADLPQAGERGVRFRFDVERVASPLAQVPVHVLLTWYKERDSPASADLSQGSQFPNCTLASAGS